MVENKAELNAKNICGLTPIHIAASEGKVEFVKFLIEHGATMDDRNEEGKSPFDLANKNGHLKVTAYLAKIRSCEIRGESALHRSSLKGNFRCMKFLIEHGANLDIKDKDGMSPLHVAVLVGKLSCNRGKLPRQPQPSVQWPPGICTNGHKKNGCIQFPHKLTFH